MYRSDRTGQRGGGTLLYISTKLGQRECLPLKRPINGIPFDSSVWCWVTPTRGKKILVGCIYRSTSSLAVNNDKLNNLLKLASEIAGGNRLLILGDFNVPNIDWINRILLPRARKLERDFFETVTDNFLFQHVKEPTRFRGTEKSTLDLIFTKEEEDIKNVQVLTPIGRSDHGAVIGEFICKWRSRVVPKKTPIYYKGKYDIIANEINQIGWREMHTEVNELVEKYNSIYKLMVEENVLKGCPRDYNEPWMNKSILKIWKNKNCAWNRLGVRNSSERCRVYRKYCDHLRSTIRKSRRLYEKKLAENSKTNKRGLSNM